MDKKIIFTIAIALFFLSSCTVQRTSVPQSNVSAQVNISMSDLDYIKDITATTTQSYVLGLPIGGEKYRSGVVSNVNGGFISLPQIGTRGTNTALFNALKQVPDADFIMPVAVEVISNRMFLGRQDSVIVRAKAFKLKQQ